MINKDLISLKRKQRFDKIMTLCAGDESKFTQYSIWLDSNAPFTTNRLMLAEVGFVLGEVTKTNWRDWIAALGEIGVKVIEYEHLDDSTMSDILDQMINEKIPECWGGEYVQEYVTLKDVPLKDEE